MIKKCHICAHVGELTWRDGKYYCAMCGSEIAEPEPQYTAPAAAAPAAPVQNAVCPICRNTNNNTPCGSQYRCALCGTMFDLGQQSYATTYAPPASPYGNSYQNKANQLRELHAQKDKKTLWGIVCLFLFWPASIYFFYKANQINKQIKQLEY